MFTFINYYIIIITIKFYVEIFPPLILKTKKRWREVGWCYKKILKIKIIFLFRSYNRVPRFEKMNNAQAMDGPEIDTWTNETAETNTNKDTGTLKPDLLI